MSAAEPVRGPAARPPGASAGARWLLLASALAGTILLGRALVLPETNLALYWPAGGVAVLGVAAARTTVELRVVLLTIFAAAMLGNLVTGVPLLAAAALGTANVVLGLAPAVWLRHAPRSGRSLRSPYAVAGAPLGAALAVRNTGDLARASIALLVGGCASAVPGAMTMVLLSGVVTPTAIGSWVVRLSVGALVVAVPLLTLPCLTGPAATGPLAASRREWLAWGREHGGETALLLAVSAGMVAAIFGPVHDLPLTYLPLLLSVWAGVRMPPVVAGLVSLLVGLLTAAATLWWGGGPFADVMASRAQAMTVQGYAVLLVGVAMALSLVIAERDALSTELGLAQVEASRRADDLAVVTATVPVGLMVVSPSLHVELANPAAHALADELLDADGRFVPRWRRLDGSRLPLEEYPSRRAVRGGSCRDVLLLDGPPGHAATRTWSVDAVVLPHRDGEDPRSLVLVRNVTDEQQHLAQLESFAGVVAHDLQNPITAARGWTDVAVDELDDAEVGPEAAVRAALDRARAATDRAGALIGDLLDYSVGRTATIRREAVDLDHLADAVVSSVEQAYAVRRPRIVVGSLGLVVGDRVLLSQLLTNVIGNAVKYTPPDRTPEVMVSAARTADDVEVTVSDRGVGVPESQLASIFEPFQRAHGGDLRFTGTGLGLAICAQAARRHGGSIRAEARDDGEGTRFVVSLPRTAGTSVSPPRAVRERADSDERLSVC